LAGVGLGNDEPPPDDAAKAKLRRQALEWLRAELTASTSLIESGPPQERPVILQSLQRWQQDPDLAGIRDEAALAEVPVDERTALRLLWDDVASLPKRTVTSGTKQTKP